MSVYSIPGLDARQIAALRVGSEGLPHGEIRESTVGRVREAGYHVTLSEKEGYAEGHCDLIVPWEPSNEDCDKLLRLFDKKRPNPAKRPRVAR